jgi:flagellar hook-associated protein 2
MISFSGLASGMDTNAIVENLVALERGQANALKRQKSDAQARMKVLDDLRAKLTALRGSAADLDEADEIRSVSASSSDEASLGVRAGSAAATGTYSVKIVKLAQSETTTSKAYAVDALGASGTLSITVGQDAAIDVAYVAGESLSDLADRINAAGARVQAVAVHDGTDHRLIVTGRETGADNALSFVDSAGELGLGETRSAQNAALEVNGLALTRPGNTITDLLPGLTLDLLNPTAGEVQVGVAYDIDAAREKTRALVDAYNGVAAAIHGQLTYAGTTRGTDTLFGDSTLRGLQRELGSLITRTYGASAVSARMLGLEVANDGSLSIDPEKFNAAVGADPTLLDDLLSDASGMAGALDEVVAKYADSSEGLLEAKQDSIRSLIDDLDSGIERIDRRADQLAVRLRRQFTALETTMAELQAQTSYVLSLFGNFGA